MSLLALFLLCRLFYAYLCLSVLLISMVWFYCVVVLVDIHGKMILISIVFYCSFVNRTSFLSFCCSIIPPGFLSCKGMAVLADTKHHVVIGEESFPAAFRNHRLRFSGKDSLPIVWLTDFFSLPSFLHIKRLSDDGYAGMTKKNSDSMITKVLKRQ